MSETDTRTPGVPSLKLLVSAVCLVFTAGMSFTYYSSELLYKADLKPVLTEMATRATHEDRLRELEAQVRTLNAGGAATAQHVKDMIAILKAVREAGVTSAKCTWYRDQYIRDLTDYVTKVRKKHPTISAEYRSCVTGSARWNLAEE